jgi:phosphonate transport system substrate-binding protein
MKFQPCTAWRCLGSVVASLLMLTSLATHTVVAADKLILASIPYRQDATLVSQFAPLTELLSRKLERPVELEIAESYKEIGARLHHQAADLGVLGPKSYVEAKEKYPDIIYLATNKNPDAFYHSLIITRSDSGLDSLAALQGTSFAYTETGSTSGYLYPRQMLRKVGLDPEILFSATYFLGKHDKVYEAVARNVVHAGAVSSTGMFDAVDQHGDVFRVLATSAPIPLNALVAGAHLPPALVGQIREILRTAEDDPAFKSSTAISKSKGFLIRDDSFYDIVRQEQEMN